MANTNYSIDDLTTAVWPRINMGNVKSSSEVDKIVAFCKALLGDGNVIATFRAVKYLGHDEAVLEALKAVTEHNVITPAVRSDMGEYLALLVGTEHDTALCREAREVLGITSLKEGTAADACDLPEDSEMQDAEEAPETGSDQAETGVEPEDDEAQDATGAAQTEAGEEPKWVPCHEASGPARGPVILPPGYREELQGNMPDKPFGDLTVYRLQDGVLSKVVR